MIALFGRLGLARPHWRHAVRATVAAVASYLVAGLFGFSHGYWAVFSGLLVVQTSTGATIAAARDRVIGTLFGGVVGAIGATLAGRSAGLTTAALAVSILITAAASARWPALKLGAVTAAIVLLSDPTHANPLVSAGERLGEIALGSLIGFIVALVVLPSRAGDHLRRSTADALEGIRDLFLDIMRSLSGTAVTGADIAERNAKIRSLLHKAEERLDESERERLGHLTAQSDLAPLVRGTRRLSHTVIMLGRIAADPLSDDVRGALGKDIARCAELIVAKITAIAAAVRASTPVEGDDSLQSAIRAYAARLDGLVDAAHKENKAIPARLFALHFALEQIDANLVELGARSNDRAS